MARYDTDEDRDAAADYAAEMAQQDDYEAPGFTSVSHPRREYRSDERFTTYDQHGFLDSEWSQ